MENIKAILEEASASLDNVVKRKVYLTHRGDFETVYKIMERYFPLHEHHGALHASTLRGLDVYVR